MSSEPRHFQSVPHTGSSYVEAGPPYPSAADQKSKDRFYEPELVEVVEDLTFYIDEENDEALEEYIESRTEATNERLQVSLNA